MAWQCKSTRMVRLCSSGRLDRMCEIARRFMEQYIMGIDIGTSACKVAVFHPDGRVAASASRAYPVLYPQNGWAEQNPEDWWRAVCLALKEALEKGNISPESILGVGVDGQSWSAILVDGEGRVLVNTPIWMDTRAAAICRRVRESVGEKELFDLCGNPFQPTYTTPKILWYQENVPELYGKACRVLQSNSFIVFRLTGALTQDKSQGYGLHCFDMRKGQWDLDMCRRLGISPELLPDIYPCHQVVGHVTAQAAALCGLAEGTPVVAGGLDAACGALGTGVLESGETQEQGGQAGGMSICTDTYRSDESLILGFHVVPDRWLLQGGTTGGGGVMRWLVRELGGEEEQEGRVLDRFNHLAEAAPPGSNGLVFLPYMAGERSPLWDPAAKGVYFGLDFGKTKGHLIRAAMEGVAYSLRHNLDVAQAAGAEVTVLRSMGGSANSLLWTQIKSDITGKEIVVPSSDTATTLGAAMLAGVGAGVYGDFREAVKMTVKNRRFHRPNEANRAVYEANYRTYRKLYEDLSGLMRESAGIV